MTWAAENEEYSFLAIYYSEALAENIEVPKPVSHQDRAAHLLPEIFPVRVTVCSSKYTSGEKNPSQQNKQATLPPELI